MSPGRWVLAVGGYAWTTETFWTVIVAILGGYVLQRMMEGIAIKWLGLEIHIWRPIDTLFRQITARRNPNLVILTVSVLLGRPDLGLHRGRGLDRPLPRPARTAARSRRFAVRRRPVRSSPG